MVPTETEAIRRVDRKYRRIGVMREEENKRLDPKTPMERLLEAIEEEEALQKAQAAYDSAAKVLTEGGYRITRIEIRKDNERYWVDARTQKLERKQL